MNDSSLPEDLYRYILDGRRDLAKNLLESAIGMQGYEKTLLAVLEPTLLTIGESWVQDGISLAQGFVAGRVAEDFLELGKNFFADSAASLYCHPADPVGSPSLARIAVLGNIEDDYHSMGRSMVSTFLKLKGWQIEDLGSDVLAKDFVDKALDAKACIIGVSAMMLTTARNIAKVRAELDSRGLGGMIKLAVGGAVFKMRPELVSEVGGDGTAVTALDAPALFENLRSSILAVAVKKLA